MVLRHSKHVHSKSGLRRHGRTYSIRRRASIVSADEEAANATTANASQTAINAFSDVNAGYWGEKYIYQLATGDRDRE